MPNPERDRVLECARGVADPSQKSKHIHLIDSYVDEFAGRRSQPHLVGPVSDAGQPPSRVSAIGKAARLAPGPTHPATALSSSIATVPLSPSR